MSFTPDSLTAAEQKLWSAFPDGTVVDLRDAPEPKVRAEVIAALLRGVLPIEPGKAPAVRLRGAHITGLLNLNCASVAVPLWLETCILNEPPDFAESSVRSISFLDCQLPGFRGKLMRVDGQLSFNQSVIKGRLALTRATVTGELELRGTHLINPGDWALFAGGLTVESAVFGVSYSGLPSPNPLTVHGGFRLVGARLLGGAFLDGTQLHNPDGIAFHGDNMHVFGRMLCGNGFRAEGSIQLPRARVEGELSFADGNLIGALSLNNAIIDDLNLRTAQPISGLVDLRHAHCAVLRDAPQSWPEAVALDGFAYDAIEAGPSRVTVAERLKWLRRDQDGYRPQPYEQLAGLYRKLGADADAHRVLLEKQRRHRHELRLPTRIVGHLLDWTVGYGYRPWRAAAWFVFALIVGTLIFSTTPPVPAGPAHHFDATMYTLDLLLPVSAFGLRDAFAPVGTTRWLAYGLTAAGWLLATALITGVTRALRRE